MEHLALLGALPYAALIAARVERRVPQGRLALAVGLFAAWSFALKPYFMLPPLLLEAWIALTLRRGWRPVRVETAALAAAAACYAMAVVAFAPDYLTGIVPVVRSTYSDFAPPFATLITRQVWLPAWLAAAAALLLKPPRTALVHASLLTAAAFFACYLWQAKGFPYHAMPVTAALAWALWLILTEAGHPLAALVRRPLVGLALGLILATTMLVGVFRAPPSARSDP